ncbi:MAG: hypothetical protein MJ240_00770 [Kiritimatiellae bacterium]|nr:hypothetical protein [Kiritimatiellia bacterium]
MSTRNAVSAFTAVALGLSFGAAQAADVSENFESVEAGAKPTGWTGFCSVAEQAGAYSKADMPGYPIAGDHAKVLAIEGSAVRAYNTTSESGNRVIDLMVMADELPEDDLPAAAGDEQIKFAFDKDGCVNIYHKPTATGAAQWSKISSTVYPSGTWVRVTFTFDYSSASVPMCQVKLDGSPCTSAAGFHSPADLEHTGSWYFTASAGTALAQIDFAGCGGVDDVVNAGTSPAAPYTPAHAGPTQTNGVDVAWLNAQGIAWSDTEVAAPGGSGYTIKESFQTGVDPYGENKLYVADSTFTDSKFTLVFNGCGRTYKVETSATPFVDGTASGTEATGTFTPNAAANTTSWTGDLPTSALTYYRVRSTAATSAETINQFAVLKVNSSDTNTLVALPWKTLTPSATDPANITAAKVVLPETLSNGDYLLYYDGGFKGWVLSGGAWTPIASSTAIGTITAAAATATELQRGQAIWVIRSDTSKPIYLCGQYLATKGEADVAAGGSLLASPDVAADFEVSNTKITGAAAGDQIAVPGAGALGLPKVFQFKSGAWGTDVTSSVPGPGGANMTKHEWKTSGDVMKIPAGKGFIYQPKGSGAKVTW